MDLVFGGVLSHPSACYSPCSPALSYCPVYCSLWTQSISTNAICQKWFTHSLWKDLNFQQIHLPSISSLVCTFSGDLDGWMEILAQSGFQADLTGKGNKLSSLLTSAFGESRGKSTLPYMIIMFLSGETGVCGVFWDSCTHEGRISGLYATPLLPPCGLTC